MGGWMYGWLYGWMDGWICGWADGCMDGWMDRYEQFLLFPQCFQKACFPGASKGVIVWEWAKNRNAVKCVHSTLK